MSQRVLEHLKNTPWVMTRDWIHTVFDIASRERISAEELRAIERELGHRLENANRGRLRDGVAVIPVHGPLFRFANLFTALSGATSMELLARDIGSALDDPGVGAIVLDIDSPGGEVTGTHELAELIFAARSEKPIIAFVSGLGASGAFWIASAASRVVVSETALLGSIGTVIAITDFSRQDEKRGIRTKEIVSRQSPKKRLDAFTPDGEQELQRIIDDLAQVFVGAVARNRAVSEKMVISDFGRGSLLVGAQAVAAGMADQVGTLEVQVQELRATSRPVGAPALRGPLSGEAQNMKATGYWAEVEREVASILAAGTTESLDEPAVAAVEPPEDATNASEVEREVASIMAAGCH